MGEGDGTEDSAGDGASDGDGVVDGASFVADFLDLTTRGDGCGEVPTSALGFDAGVGDAVGTGDGDGVGTGDGEAVAIGVGDAVDTGDGDAVGTGKPAALAARGGAGATLEVNAKRATTENVHRFIRLRTSLEVA